MQRNRRRERRLKTHRPIWKNTLEDFLTECFGPNFQRFQPEKAGAGRGPGFQNNRDARVLKTTRALNDLTAQVPVQSADTRSLEKTVPGDR
jgi:hypothetical protein